MVERPQAQPRTNDLDAGEGWRMLSRGKSEVAANHVIEASPPRFGAAAVMAASAVWSAGSRVNARTYLGARTRGSGDMMIDGVPHARRGRSLYSGRPGGPGGGYAKEPAATPLRLIGGQAHARRP
jgi:hypothetical protein